MKTWNEPVMEELEINATAGGGLRSEKHDGVWISWEHGEYEGTYPSGK